MDLQYDPDVMADEIRAADGNVRAAARSMQCGAATIYRYMRRFEHVNEAVDEARQATYAEAVDNVVRAMQGAEDVDIDQQWATKRILETYGETISDDLTWTSKQRAVHVENLGITILPSNGSPVRDSDTTQPLQDRAVRDVLPAESQS